MSPATPTLSYSRSSRASANQAQFAVFYTNLPTGVTLASAVILVTFGRKGRTNRASTVASPFRNGNNARCLAGDEGSNLYSPGPAYYVGPYTVAFNQAAVGNGTLSFEFSMVAKFTLSNGQVYEYGYDPELDVDVGN